MCGTTGRNLGLRLLVDSGNDHLRFKPRGIIQSSDFDDERGWPHRTKGADGSTKGGAEKACHQSLHIASLECRGCALGESEAIIRYYHNGDGVFAGNILAFGAVAL